ncbi:MAG: hypothetical protein NTX61_03780 [Bacteroidetes bacterium]|nr:hypothetical protein [Bacteroidota bacterium]
MKKIFTALMICACSISIITAQTIRVINMIPNASSNETGQDSEPFLTINPNNPLEIIATAFTSNPTGAVATAPVFISQDGGNTWVLNNIIPSLNGCTGDITVGLSRNNVLYAGILTGGYYNPADPYETQMQILRSTTYLAVGTMGNLLTRLKEDQPYAELLTPLGGSGHVNLDHVYIGHNDFNNSPKTASFDQTLDGATAAAPAGFTTIRLERRNPHGQDGPPIRAAIHPKGVVYAIYYERTNSVGSTRTGDIIVVRDDSWGQSASPYSALTDPSDGLAGRKVVTGISWTWNPNSAMGQDRLGDKAAIAVDPRDSRRVYIAYVDLGGGTGNTATIHVRRSDDSGSTWSGDLLPISQGTVPQLSVNTRGDVAFLYQQLTGTAPNQRWETHFRQSSNTGTSWTNLILSQTPSNSPAYTFLPYLGDYACLRPVGKDFYGVFSANNTPNNANFPQGVTYQRNANFATNQIRNLANTSNRDVSIDPFFFSVQQISNDQDFYVRDWTDNATSCDNGLEPSTHPVFYNTSDIWNKKTNVAGAFNANDQPVSYDPQIASLGNNFAFARVHRKGTGSAQTVTLHFLKSELGTGSNFIDANSTADPTLIFAAGEQEKIMTSGYEWTLVSTTSTHTCIAVEIRTAADPVVTPTLLNRAPGWPDTDLSVLYDNNKAQRNMEVCTTPSGSGDGGSITYYAVLHNAATFKRDMILEFTLSESYKSAYKQPLIVFPESNKKEIKVTGNRILVPHMLPGENQWIGITFPVQSKPVKGMASVDFSEVVNNIPINGFTVAMKNGTLNEVFSESSELYLSVLYRAGKIFRMEMAMKEYDITFDMMRKAKDAERLLPLLKERMEPLKKLIMEIIRMNNGSDPFGIQKNFDDLNKQILQKNYSGMVVSLENFSHSLDPFLTMSDKKTGDIADIVQNFRWQADLFLHVKQLINSSSQKYAQKSDQVVTDFENRKISYSDYGHTMKDFESYLKLITEIVKKNNLDLTDYFRKIYSSLEDPKALQKAHYDFLLKLEELR